MKLPALSFVLAALLCSSPGSAQQAGPRDEFFWLGEINKATAVINTDEGLLDRALGVVLQAHNLTPGMPDPKDVKADRAMVESAITVLRDWDRVLNALVINPARALEELNGDWTASQELADLLMRKYRLPFRIGYHFASEVVEYAKANDIKPLDFPYPEARRIYAQAVQGLGYPPELPMGEEEFRATLDPVAIVRHRATVGGPQPAEMQRMLKLSMQRSAQQEEWINNKRAHILNSLASLDRDFSRLLSGH
jgi:argininosuccinate lyase